MSTWILDEFGVLEDGGDVGGDGQIGNPEWERTEFDTLDTSPAATATVEAAEAAALAWIKALDPERDLTWTGPAA